MVAGEEESCQRTTSRKQENKNEEAHQKEKRKEGEEVMKLFIT